jgi:hypothetical protein
MTRDRLRPELDHHISPNPSMEVTLLTPPPTFKMRKLMRNRIHDHIDKILPKQN